MSGFEIAGLVLAVIPIFTKASHPIVDAANAARPQYHTKKLEEFYDDFYAEIYRIKKLLESIIRELPSLSLERKDEILNRQPLTQSTWLQDTDLLEDLNAFFPLDEDRETFLHALGRILALFWKLVEDKTAQLSRDELTSLGMYERIRDLARGGNIPVPSYWTRLRFNWRGEKRRKSLYRVREARELLSAVIESNTTSINRDSSGLTSESTHFSRLRTISQKMIATLSTRWSCGCDKSHRAHLELSQPTRISRGVEATLDFAVSQETADHTTNWYEVGVKGTHYEMSSPGMPPNTYEAFTNVCFELKHSIPLHIMIHGLQGPSTTVWLQKVLDQALRYQGYTVPVSLKTLLSATSSMPDITTRRRLALLFASALHRLGENLHLGLNWTKDKIFFFDQNGVVDYRHPFLSSNIASNPYSTTPSPRLQVNGASIQQPPQAQLFHPHEATGALAILLIELTVWRPIESLRKWEDMNNGSVDINTNLRTAHRELAKGERLAQCYGAIRWAIKACLNPQWGVAGRQLTLDDEETRNGLYRDVIQPLTLELSLCQNSAKFET